MYHVSVGTFRGGGSRYLLVTEDITRALVLLVEGERALREWIADTLSNAGFHVERPPDDNDPVAFAEQIGPQVIVTGEHARNRSGTLVSVELQKNPRTSAIPVVLYRIPRHSGATPAPAPGTSDVLFLPRDFPILASTVARALGEPPPSASPPESAG